MPKSFTILNIGLDRELLAPEGSNESQLRQIIYAEGLPAKIIHLVKAPSSWPTEGVTLAAGSINVVPVPVRHWALFPFAVIPVAQRILRVRRVDAIQIQEPFLCGLPGMLLSRRYRLPLIAGAFSDQVDNPAWLHERVLHRLANVFGKRVYRRAAAIRADSRAVADRLHSLGYGQAQFVPFLITHSHRLREPAKEAATIRKQLLGSRHGPLLLTVSRLEREKNVQLLLEVFQRALTHIPDLVLAIVGEGSLRRELQTISARYPHGSVNWIGWVPNERIAAYYQATDLFLLGSNYESSARVLTEALMAGTPVLTTDTAGAREVVQDRHTGRIVPVGDADAFMRALMELCQDLDALARMGRNAQAMMTELVSRDAVLDSLRKLYEGALRNHESVAL